ncbi:NADH-quinone oxidoreductase subunit N [Limnoglobus roseus]|uniref:NADH-quinone oxidoreductase subunit N n=1 Tax=Limnoglobus roseus TaxID=2598579 RepID=A0A5C1A776_9BACT|nr:NADH-quinone oxidoreductase subunit N [Limnoglobus roseus]QEL14285.1 NADH-quinone oxidoreductase subunit N [Limnoglobus roseus]
MPLDAELARLDATLAHDLLRFGPELLLCLGIVGSLFAKLFRAATRVQLVPFALLLTLVALGLVASDAQDSAVFGGLLRLDSFANFFRVFLLLTAALVLALTRLTGLPDATDSADFVTLLLGGTLGMMLMASANHLIMVFLAIEMASLPSYVLAGFLKGKGRSSEAALKYVVYGAAASGVMLYGISLLVGQLGTAYLPSAAESLGAAFRSGGFSLSLTAGLLFLFVGLGFKLAVLPFQFWLPDVFEGAAAEVGAMLAVASKAAAVGLTLRLLFVLFQHVPIPAVTETVSAALAGVAVLTATLGNVAALVQTNLKRLLAYSTIAHAGYMLMAIACIQRPAAAAVLFYLAGYLPMTLGAFAVVAVLRSLTGSEEIDAARGLLKRSPVLGVCTAVFLFSLLGVPPLAGFAGKFQVFTAVYRTGAFHAAGGHPWLGTLFNVVLAAGVVNTVVSAGYYLKVLKAVALDDPTDETPLGEGVAVRLYLLLLTAAVVVVGVWWDPLTDLTWRAAVGLG